MGEDKEETADIDSCELLLNDLQIKSQQQISSQHHRRLRTYVIARQVEFSVRKVGRAVS